MNQTKWLTIDAVLILILGAGSVVSVTDALGSLLVILTGCYLLLDALSRRGGLEMSSRTLYQVKLTIVLLAVSVAVLLPAISMIILRRSTSPEKYIQDGALQTELTVEYLLQGRNPYAEDYRGTALAAWAWDAAAEGTRENPALDHNAYLPFTFMFSLPFYALLKTGVGWYDQRLVYVPLFFLTLMPLAQHAVRGERKLGLLILFGLNLFIAPYAAWGGNDCVVLFWLVLSTYFLLQSRTAVSALSLGLACASKQIAWLFVPFFLAHVWVKAPPTEKLRAVRNTYPLWLVSALLILPFFLWNPSAFLDDTIFYMSGGAAASYPIRGVGIGSLMLTLGIVSDKAAYFPFALLQVASCLPLLVFLLRQQTLLNEVRQCWLGFGLLLFTFSFFSRFFNVTLLGVVVASLGIGLLAEDHGASTLT